MCEVNETVFFDARLMWVAGLSIDHDFGRVRIVTLHIGLEIKVGDLVTLLSLKERLELRVRADYALVLGILQAVFLDVRVDVLDDLSSGHLGAHVLANKLAQFRGDVARFGDAAHGGITTGFFIFLFECQLRLTLHFA